MLHGSWGQRMRQMQSKKVSGNKGICAFKRKWQAEINLNRWWWWWWRRLCCTLYNVKLKYSHWITWNVSASWTTEWCLRASMVMTVLREWMNLWTGSVSVFLGMFSYFLFQLPSLYFPLCLDKTRPSLDKCLFLMFSLTSFIAVITLAVFLKYVLQVHFRDCVVWEFFWGWRAFSF